MVVLVVWVTLCATFWNGDINMVRVREVECCTCWAREVEYVLPGGIGPLHNGKVFMQDMLL